MNQVNFRQKKFEKLETAIYNTYDMINVLKCYCDFHEDIKQINCLNHIFEYIFEEFDKICEYI